MEELKHYGVLGMKWGVHRARSKVKSNKKLQSKALYYDKKAAMLTKKSEKVHSKIDLEKANRAAKKSATYSAKAAKLAKQAVKSTTDSERLRYEKKSEKMKYKAAKAKVDADRVSKTVGYSGKSMRYLIKSDKAAMKAAKARKELATNKMYISMMDRKISSLSKEDLKGAYSFVNEYTQGGNSKWK